MAVVEFPRPDRRGEQAGACPPHAIEERLLSRLESGDSGAVLAVESAIEQAIRHGASDLYFEPHRTSTLLRFRIDGVLHDVARLPKSSHERIVSRIKVLARLPVYQHGAPMDGRIDGDARWGGHGLRVSTLPTIEGEKAVLRVVNRDATAPSLESLGFRDEVVAGLRGLIARPQGVLFLTGPSSSGKTTTIYSLLAEILRTQRRTHVVAVEDPVEYRLDGVCQSEVNADSGYDYAAAVRAILRQDPDVIVIGEIRDRPTAQAAIRAGLTGHLVLTTIHSGTAAGVFTRLLDMGLEPYLVASAAIGALAQRLVRRVCPSCRAPYAPAEALAAQFGFAADRPSFVHGSGCDACNGLGFSGRTAIGELLRVSEPIAELILSRARTRLIQNAAQDAGMTALAEDGIDRVCGGITTLEELRLVVSPGEDAI